MRCHFHESGANPDKVLTVSLRAQRAYPIVALSLVDDIGCLALPLKITVAHRDLGQRDHARVPQHPENRSAVFRRFPIRARSSLRHQFLAQQFANAKRWENKRVAQRTQVERMQG